MGCNSATERGDPPKQRYLWWLSPLIWLVVHPRRPAREWPRTRNDHNRTYLPRRRVPCWYWRVHHAWLPSQTRLAHPAPPGLRKQHREAPEGFAFYTLCFNNKKDQFILIFFGGGGRNRIGLYIAKARPFRTNFCVKNERDWLVLPETKPLENLASVKVQIAGCVRERLVQTLVVKILHGTDPNRFHRSGRSLISTNH